MSTDNSAMQPARAGSGDAADATPWREQAAGGGRAGENHHEVQVEHEADRGLAAGSTEVRTDALVDRAGAQPAPHPATGEIGATMPGAADDMQPNISVAFAGIVQATVAAFLGRLDRIEQRLATVDHDRDAKQSTLTDTLASLEKQIGRAGREQFRASTLAEAQRDQLQAVLEVMQQSESEREAQLAEVREGATIAVKQARLAMARAIIPAIDGMDEALRSGSRLAVPAQAAQPPRLPWIGRRERNPPESGLRVDLRAWLAGLEFVRERLIDVLAAEGIRPIPAEGQLFDPEVHLALEVSEAGPETPPGTISAVIRRGYRYEQGVLRPAEVVVARADTP
jgi:hypothetical protein